MAQGPTANPPILVPLGPMPMRAWTGQRRRVTKRTGRRLAVLDAWRRASVEISHRSGSSRQARSLQGSRPGARAPSAARADRAGRLAAKRRLHLRRPAPWRSDYSAVSGIGHVLQFCDHKYCGIARGSCGLTAPNRAAIGGRVFHCGAVSWSPAVSLPRGTRRNPVCASGLETSRLVNRRRIFTAAPSSLM